MRLCILQQMWPALHGLGRLDVVMLHLFEAEVACVARGYFFRRPALMTNARWAHFEHKGVKLRLEVVAQHFPNSAELHIVSPQAPRALARGVHVMAMCVPTILASSTCRRMPRFGPAYDG